jgi:hypothetical protein
MTRRLLILLACVYCAGCSSQDARTIATRDSLPKLITTTDVTCILSGISQIAVAHHDDIVTSNSEALISSLIDSAKTLDDLTIIAMCCRDMEYKMLADNHRVDDIFDCAFWVCVSRVANNPSEAAGEALTYLEKRFCTDGGDHQRISESISYQRELSQRARAYIR